jgi:hypothetical protein
MIDRAAERKKQKTLQGILLLALAGLLVAAGFYYEMVLAPAVRPRDTSTLCPMDGRPPASAIVVLLDTTDRLSAVQQTQVINELARTIDDAPQYTKIQLFAVGPAGNTMLRPLATVCNPGSGKGANTWNSNPELMQRRWQKKFLIPLDYQLDALLNAPPADTSPILESIQNVAAGVFDAPASDGIPKQLVIVSDMVQNSTGFSQYRRFETFEQFKRSSYYLTVRPHLDGVEVSILYLRRADVRRIQGLKHTEFGRTTLRMRART